jgi:hypothetical protein
MFSPSVSWPFTCSPSTPGTRSDEKRSTRHWARWVNAASTAGDHQLRRFPAPS